MAIAFDSSAQFITTHPNTNYSFNNVAGNIAFVGMGVQNSGKGDYASGMTYAGAAADQIFKVQISAGNNDYMYLFMFENAATGANNIRWTGTDNASDLGAVSYSGAAITGQPDASRTTAVAGSSTFSQAINTVADNSWVVLCMSPGSTGDTTNPSSTTNYTQRQAFDVSTIGDTNAAVHPAGSLTQSGTFGGSNTYGVLQVSFSPPAAAGGSLGARNLALMGAGS